MTTKGASIWDKLSQTFGIWKHARTHRIFWRVSSRPSANTAATPSSSIQISCTSRSRRTGMQPQPQLNTPAPMYHHACAFPDPWFAIFYFDVKRNLEEMSAARIQHMGGGLTSTLCFINRLLFQPQKLDGAGRYRLIYDNRIVMDRRNLSAKCHSKILSAWMNVLCQKTKYIYN